jgi:sn-glycerol 3-phosphate transport system substrate-binding protein
MKNRFLGAFAGTLMSLWASISSAAPLEIQFWHPSLGPLDEALKQQVDAFNNSQTAYKVVSSGRGTYDETFNAAIAGFRANKHPHLLVVIGQGTQSMLLSGAVYPVQDLLAAEGHKVNWDDYLQPVLNYYRTKEGKLLSLPFSVSTPILWYNKDAFAKAGLARAPVTLDELGEYAGKLRAAGYECGYTSGWQQWVHVDNYSVIHDLPIATRHNGLDGLDATFVYNKTAVVKNIARLQSWVADGRYVYSGRQGSSATPAFTSGRCAMMTQSSAVFASVTAGAKFAFGAAPLPYEAGATPHNSLIGGGSLWVLKGYKPEEYKGVAAFLAHLTSPDQQAKWHKDTGYVPLTKAAYEKVKAEGYYDKNPQQEVAITQIQRGTPTLNTMTVRLGNANQYVAALEEELEAVWANKKTAQEAMDDAVRRGNEILRRFEKQRGN